MAGYNRNSPNPFVDGAIIEANDFDTEFGNLDIAFGTSGHNHDGTDGNGPKITTVGLADDAVTGDKIDSATTITAASFVGPLTGNITSTNGTITNLTIGSSTAVTSVDTDLSSVSATDNSLASAKAIKAYVDAQVASENELTEMNDVVITSVADNEVLAYDNASSKWINQTAVEAGLQPNDAGLTSIAGLATSANQMIYTTGSDAYATTSLTEAGRAILDDADASAQRTTLGLTIGTNVQAYSANLATIAGLAVTDGNIIVGNGTSWVAESGDTARTSLGLAIGTNVQAYSDKLATIAGLAVTDGNIIVGNGTTWAAESGDTARTSLGLAIGSDVQAYNANLTTIAALTPTDGNFIVGNGTDWVAESGGTVRSSLGLAIGTDVQAYDANLATIGALTPTDSNFIVGNGTDWVAESGDTVRTSLGLSIGSNVQAYSANLETLAALTPTDSNFIVGNGTDWVAESGDTVRTSLGLAIGTNVQAYDAGLTSIAGLTTAADKMIYTTGSDTYAVTDLSAYGRSLIDDADAASARTTLGLGTAATTAATDYATAAQGTLADSAVQPGDNISGLTNDSGYITGYTVTQSDVTAHQAALSITESQISDLGAYITGNQTITLSGDATGSGTTSIAVTLAANTVGVNELALSDGTAGQFLKTDGAGTISFADAPAQGTSFTTLEVEPTSDHAIFSLQNTATNTFGSSLSYHEIRYQAKDLAGVDTTYAEIEGRTYATGERGQLNFLVKGASGIETYLALVGDDQRIEANKNIRFNTAGTGIDFSATSDATGMSSELLDDYEEGAWIPNFSDGTTTVTTGGTRIGKYVKVGQMVTAWASISNGQTTGLTSTASLRITGLPFTGENANAIERANSSSALLEGVSYTTDPVVYLTNNGNRDYVNIWDQGAGTSIKVSDVTSGTNFISFTLTYLAG